MWGNSECSNSWQDQDFILSCNFAACKYANYDSLQVTMSSGMCSGCHVCNFSFVGGASKKFAILYDLFLAYAKATYMEINKIILYV